MLPTCKLCLTNPADKTGSHIVSKFLVNKALIPYLAPDPKSRQAREFVASKERPVQDTPKHDHIFCSTCETRFGVIETELAPFFVEILNHETNMGKFDYYSTPQIERITHTTLPNNLFRTFIFTLIWRVSISDNNVFKSFKLHPDAEELIRGFLNAILRNNQNDLLANLPPEDNLPFSFFFRKRKNLGSTPGMGLAATNDGRLFLANYILNFQDCADLDSELRKSVPIFLVENDEWDKFSFIIQ